MRLRRFEAATVREALQLVRSDLGPDAIILHARESDRETGGGAQVIAALDADPTPSPQSPVAAQPAVCPPPAPPAGLPPEAEERLEEIRALLESALGGADDAAGVPAAVRPLYRSLRRRELPADAARRLVRAPGLSGARAGRLTRAAAVRAMAPAFRVPPPAAAPPARRVVVLVGPTGVGKTTTIAKLAGQRCREGSRLSLVSVDTYRIGAVAQMRIYADLLAAPLHVVRTAAELAEALAASATADLILVDTTGRSPAHREAIGRLPRLLAALPDPEIHLVVSATTKGSDLEQIVRAFRPTRYQCLLLTKLDEARSAGAALGVALRHELPISFLATGQEVPDDLEPATPARLASLLLPKGWRPGGAREEA